MNFTTQFEIQRFLEQIRHNLVALEKNLLDLGYKFARANGAVQLADESDRSRLETFRSRKGPLPLLYYYWYTMFRSVDFSQTSEQLKSPSDEPVAGLGLNCPLVFLDLESCIRLRVELSTSGFGTISPEGKGFLPTGAVASNCTPKGIWLPDSSADPILYDEGAGPVTMADELCVAIKSGGFPFWDRLFRRRRFTSPLANTPKFKELKPLLIRSIVMD